MANPMNNYSLDFSTGRDESEDPRDSVPGHLHPSLTSGDPALMAFPNPGNYAFGAVLPEEDDELPLQAFNRPHGPQGDLEGRLSNVMLAYDSIPSTVSMPMNLDASGAFAYDIPTTYPATTMGLAPSMDQQRQLQQVYPPFPQPVPQSNQYLQQQQQQPPAPSTRNDLYNSTTTATNSTGSFDDSDFSRGSDPSQARQPRPLQDSQRYPQYNQPTQPAQPAQPAPYRASQPVAIQPKQPTQIKACPVPQEDYQSPGLSTPDAAKNEHTGIYSSSGFDILGVLSRVSVRPNPKINIGAVDLSCAFVLCDITRQDHPIVYVSDAFERLTGYARDEIVDRNCRFLQGPDGKVDAGAKRTFVDGQTVHRLRSTIRDRTEIQASIINYRKGGQPFMNLITMIPIRWDSDDYRFYVGFQVDLVEKPDAITRRNPDGNYTINYQRDQLPQYIVPPPDVYRLRPDLLTQFGHDQVTAILNAAGVPGSGVSRNYLDRILVENSDDVIHVLSFNGEFLYLSPSCHKILEYDPVELVGKTLSTICHPSDIGPVIRDLRASTTPAPVSVVYRIRQKYKGYMWFESHGAWHIDPQQGRKYLVMTGRPRPVYALDQIAQLGTSAALAENDVWAKVSLSGVILFMTTKSKPVLGRPPDDFIGKGLHELMEPEGGPNAISDALEAAAKETGNENDGKKNDGSDKNLELPSFRHQMRHKKGHSLSAHTTIYSGDSNQKVRPTFLVIQIRFARAFPPSPTALEAAADENLANAPGSSKATTLSFKDANPPRQYGALGQRIPDLSSFIGLNGLPTGNRSISPSDVPATFFTELNPTRGSSWQIELRELEKQNRTLAEELQRLVSRKKKRKRKQTAISVEKACSMCSTKNTPEWRRGPSGNRDLCNSCGLRWAKQNRIQAQTTTDGGSTATVPATTMA
ncbi:White collar 1 protein [Penicillium waksmanii]|uniref:White collar 1 protein n=1 Tax=Penicillium waksmanii TaxID=69791 RepID=UPI0025473FCA|nr:White collar 1 protein [Penicillium waksmanii]KAJ5965963.1 White collar 1 protein [Penicillium waksmanii]